MSGEREVVQEAHAAYYLRLAEMAEPEFRGPQQAPGLIDWSVNTTTSGQHCIFCLSIDKGEIALRLGSALYWFWIMRDHASEGWNFLEQGIGC